MKDYQSHLILSRKITSQNLKIKTDSYVAYNSGQRHHSLMGQQINLSGRKQTPLKQATVLWGLLASLMASPVNAADEGEALFAYAPASWIPLQQLLNPQVDIYEFLPPSETIKNWRQKLAVTVQRGDKGLNIDWVVDNLKGLYVNSCTSRQFYAIPSKPARNLPVHAMVYACGRHKESGKGEISAYKLIRGRDALYTVQWSWQVAPFDATKPIPLDRQIVLKSFETLDLAVTCILVADPATKKKIPGPECTGPAPQNGESRFTVPSWFAG